MAAETSLQESFMLPIKPALPFAPAYVSPLILEAVTRDITPRDRARTEQMRGSKRVVDAGFLGAPPPCFAVPAEGCSKAATSRLL